MPLVSISTEPIIRVGVVGGEAAKLVLDRAGVLVVNTVPDVREHWRRHQGQFDVLKAEALVSDVLDNPLRVYQGQKPNTLVFVGHYEEDRFIVIPVKCLPGELWIGTLFVPTIADFESKGWVKRGLIFERS